MKENRLSQIDYYPLSTTSTRLTTSNIPNFITAQKLLEDKFSIEISKKDKKKRLELAIGDKVCFVKPPSDLICDTIVRGLLPKKFGGLESTNVYVLVADNKLEFYKIVEKAHKKY
ncbi:MAG TPA: hypothetical protein VLA74_04060, partial [Nitrososphaeraceae archaeon]|nr:hypothetical protein [Nitrososphaeraceae archaeon]